MAHTMTFKDLKQKMDLAAVTAKVHDTDVRRCGTYLLEFDDQLCPFCGAGDAFRIHEDTQTFRCYSCNAGGDVTDFVAMYRKLSLPGAAAEISNMAADETLLRGEAELTPIQATETAGAHEPTSREWSIKEAAAAYYTSLLHRSDSALTYQTVTRGHARDTLVAHRIGYSDGGLIVSLREQGFSLDELKAAGLGNRVGRDLLPKGGFVYPHMDAQGRVCHFTFKHPTLGKCWQLSKASRYAGITFYGEHTLTPDRQAHPAAIVEGENDVLSLLEAGWRGPVLGTNGQPSREQWAWLETKFHGKRVMTFFDADDAGMRFRKGAAELTGLQLEQYIPPAPAKDVDEYLKRYDGNLQALTQPEHQWLPTSGEASDQVSEPSNRALVPDFTSELTNARLLRKMLGQNACFVRETASWAFCHENGCWEFDRKDLVTNVAKQIGQIWHREADAKLALNPEISGKLRSFANRSESLPAIENMMKLAASEPGMMASVQDFDNNPNLLGVMNGVLELDHGAFRPLVPADMVSKRCRSDYDPTMACPTWLAFLESVTAHLGAEQGSLLIQYLQKICGALLLGQQTRRPFFFVYGPPASGKSVFSNLVHYMLGDYARSLNPKALSLGASRDTDVKNPELASLPGYRACIIPETGDENCFNDELIKAMTGGDPIKARGLYQAPIEFVFGGILIFVGNSFPASSTGGQAFMQRIKIVGFPTSVAPEARDEQLPEKLKAEAPGILHWMLEGAQLLRENGWHEPDVVKQDTARYRESTDVVGAFLDECCRKGPGLRVIKKELYAAYREWARENGFGQLKFNRFATRIEGAGLVEMRYNNVRCWAGITLHDSSCVPYAPSGGVIPKYQM